MDSSDLAWARCEGRWLGMHEERLSPGFALALGHCRSVCLQEQGLARHAEAFERAAAALHELLARFGTPRPENPNVFGAYAWDPTSRMAEGDPLVRGALALSREEIRGVETAFRRTTAFCGDLAPYPKAAAWLESLPEPWRRQPLSIERARKSKARVKSANSALPSRSLGRLVDASRAVHQAREAVLACEPALRELRARSKPGGLAGLDARAAEVGLMAVGALGAAKATVGPCDAVEVAAPEARFAPQRAYAGFVVGKGFYGSEKSEGVDLGAARLFDSEDRAREHFSRKAGSYAIVEVEVRVGAVKHWLGGGRDAELEAAAALEQAKEIDRALERAGVEKLRERLESLTKALGQAVEEDACGVSIKAPRRL